MHLKIRMLHFIYSIPHINFINTYFKKLIEPSTESTIEIFSRAPGGNKPSEDLSSVLFIVKSFISISLLFCEINMQQNIKTIQAI